MRVLPWMVLNESHDCDWEGLCMRDWGWWLKKKMEEGVGFRHRITKEREAYSRVMVVWVYDEMQHNGSSLTGYGCFNCWGLCIGAIMRPNIKQWESWCVVMRIVSCSSKLQILYLEGLFDGLKLHVIFCMHMILDVWKYDGEKWIIIDIQHEDDVVITQGEGKERKWVWKMDCGDCCDCLHWNKYLARLRDWRGGTLHLLM